MNIYIIVIFALVYVIVLRFAKNIYCRESGLSRHKYQILRLRILWQLIGLVLICVLGIIAPTHDHKYAIYATGISLGLILFQDLKHIGLQQRKIFGGRALIKGPDPSWK